MSFEKYPEKLKGNSATYENKEGKYLGKLRAYGDDMKIPEKRLKSK